MMNPNASLTELAKIVNGLNQTVPSTSTPDYVSLKLYPNCTILIKVSNTTTVTGSAITVKQATNVGGGDEKPLAFTKARRNLDPANTDTLSSFDVTNNTFTTDATNNASLMYVLDVRPDMLDVANGYDCVRLGTGDAVNASVSALYVLWPLKHQGAAGVAAAAAVETEVFSATTDGLVTSHDENTDYAAARAGTGTPGLSAATNGAEVNVGQQLADGEFRIWELFFNFDLLGAGVGASDTVDAAELSFWVTADVSVADFTLEARARDWGDELTTADFVPGANLGALTLLASVTTAGLPTGAYVTLTESGTALRDAVAAALAGDGVLRLLLCSSRTVAGDEPSGSEYVTLSTADEPSAAQHPRLVVTHTPA